MEETQSPSLGNWHVAWQGKNHHAKICNIHRRALRRFGVRCGLGRPGPACGRVGDSMRTPLMRPLAKIPGANCKVDSVKTVCDVTSISLNV
jgi:hypothetical protein